MALFKVSIKRSGRYNGCKVENGMEVEVSFDRGINNLTGTIQGQEIIVAAFQRKYVGWTLNLSWALGFPIWTLSKNSSQC